MNRGKDSNCPLTYANIVSSLREKNDAPENVTSSSFKQISEAEKDRRIQAVMAARRTREVRESNKSKVKDEKMDWWLGLLALVVIYNFATGRELMALAFIGIGLLYRIVIAVEKKHHNDE